MGNSWTYPNIRQNDGDYLKEDLLRARARGVKEPMDMFNRDRLLLLLPWCIVLLIAGCGQSPPEPESTGDAAPYDRACHI